MDPYNVSSGTDSPDDPFKVHKRYLVDVQNYYLFAALLFVIIGLLSIMLYTALLWTSRYIVRWDPLVKITYSLAAVDLWTVCLMTTGIVANSLLPSFLPELFAASWTLCWSYALETVRLGAMYSEILHIALLAGLHCASASSDPGRLRDKATFAVKYCLAPMWLAPSGVFALVFVLGDNLVRRQSCAPKLITSDWFRFGIATAFALPVLVSLFFYMVLARRLQQHGRANRAAASVRKRSAARVDSCNGGVRVRRRGWSRTACATFTMATTFALAWLPSVLWLVVTCDACVQPSLDMMRRWPRLNALIGIAVNLPLFVKFPANAYIYAWRIPAMRVATCRMLGVVPADSNMSAASITSNRALLRPNPMPSETVIKTNAKLHRRDTTPDQYV